MTQPKKTILDVKADLELPPTDPNNPLNARLVDHHHRQLFAQSLITDGYAHALDTAIYAAFAYWRCHHQPQRNVILSRVGSRYGASLLGRGLNGELRPIAHPWMVNIVHVPAPIDPLLSASADPIDACAQTIAMLGADRIAALIAEPIQIAGAAVIPDRDYWQQLTRLCRQHQILLISDESFCGLGRLGEWLGCSFFDIQPEIAIFGSHLSARTHSIAAIACNQPVAEALNQDFTPPPPPLPLALAALKQHIELIEQRLPALNRNLIPQFGQLALQLQTRPKVRQIKVAGLLGLIEIEGCAPTLAAQARQHGLALAVRDSSLVIAPDLAITAPQCQHLFSVLKQILT